MKKQIRTRPSVVVGASTPGTALGFAAPPAARQGRWRGPRPQIGLSVLVASAAFPVRFEVIAGQSAAIFDLVVVICAIQLALIWAARGKVTHPPRQIMFGMLIPTLLTVVSLWWSENFARTFLTAASWMEAVIVMIFVTVTLGDQNPSVAMKWIARLGVALLIAPILMYLHVSGFDPPAPQVDPFHLGTLPYYTRFSHPFLGKSNNLATLLVILFVPLVYWAARYHRHRLATITIGLAILLTLSRGAIAALMVSWLFWTISKRDRSAKFGRSLIIPFCGALAVGLSILVSIPVVAAHLGERADISGLNGRQELWNEGWSSLSQSPLIGVGGGADAALHNTYAQQLVDFGLPLGILALICLLQIPRWFFTVGEVNTPRHDLARAAGMGVLTGYLTFLTESSLEGTLLRPVIFLCIALCVALTQAGLRLKPPEPSEDSIS